MRRLLTETKVLFFLTSAIFFSPSIYSQPIDPGKDAIPEADAIAIHGKYKGQAGNKGSEALYINNDQMLEICNALKAKGIPNVAFLIASLRMKDVPNYKAHHPELSGVPDRELNKKHILIIRVPKTLFDTQKQSGAFNNVTGNPLMIALQSYGLFILDRPYNLPYFQDYMYLELSIICPPPNVCN
jgi:hypothetical protein